jgi:hypothetical protein
MKSKKLNEKVLKKLHEFETLENIHPSSDWDAELYTKLQLNSSIKTNIISKYNVIIICIVLLNSGLLLFSLLNEPKQSSKRTTNLKLISNELLITSN